MDVNRDILITMQSLTVGYRSGSITRELFPAVSTRVGEGEVISVIGQNGVGKSTLLRTIAGLHPAASGGIFIKGKNLVDYDRSDLAKCIGYVSTEPVRVASMRVIDSNATRAS